ncbi:MAG: putative signal transduction histidine kinase [Bacteroidetes bacterium]|nr:MAG: putative signal transduction histidine kinase [Bacteroidota bacterium]
MTKRILLHLAFWLIYFCIVLYNDLFLSASFLANPSWPWASKAILAQSLLLLIKIATVYYTLYLLIPHWMKARSKIVPVLETLALCIVALVLYRLMIQVVIWKWIYNSEAALNNLSFVARAFHSLLDILQVAGVAAAIKLLRLRLAAAQKEKALVREKLSSEILHLKSQVNPHFLFNSLNSVFALSRMQSEKTPDLVMRLSNILRYMLYQSEKEFSTIGEEVKIIRDYIELQQLRFGDRVTVKTEINIDEPAAQITPLLLLPLVENAFKHGVGGVAGNTEISIRIAFRDGRLVMQTGNAVSAENTPETGETGIGLSNIRRQLELLYKDYTFTAEKKEQVFSVNLHINIKSYAGTELYHH